MEQQLSTIAGSPLVGLSAVSNASEIATGLKKVIESQKLYTDIQGKKYVNVEGWTTLGAMLGIFPRVEETKDLSGSIVKRILVGTKQKKFDQYKKIWTEWEKKSMIDPELVDDKMTIYKKADGTSERGVKETKYYARVSVYHKDQLICSGDAICSNLEGDKLQNPEYAILSMAQTRATGKAFRLCLSWIMAMAGYEATPWEEMADFAPPVAPEKSEEGKPSSVAKEAVLEVENRVKNGSKIDPKEVAERASKTGDFKDEDFNSLSKSLGI